MYANACNLEDHFLSEKCRDIWEKSAEMKCFLTQIKENLSLLEKN